MFPFSVRIRENTDWKMLALFTQVNFDSLKLYINVEKNMWFYLPFQSQKALLIKIFFIAHKVQTIPA